MTDKLLFLGYLPMLSKENEVSLVVKGHNTPANELRVMGKQ